MVVKALDVGNVCKTFCVHFLVHRPVGGCVGVWVGVGGWVGGWMWLCKVATEVHHTARYGGPCRQVFLIASVAHTKVHHPSPLW